MMDNFGFRINKYFKVSLVIGLIDLLIFYVVGKVFKYMNLFHIIIENSLPDYGGYRIWEN